MPGNRFALTPHFAMAPEDEGGATGNGVASRPPELGSSGPQGTPTPGVGGSAPASTRTDATAAAEPQADNVAPASRNAAPAAKSFPETWRQDLAGSDKAFRKTLDRFESPVALAKAYRELTARLSSGELKATKPPPDNATSEQIAVWRAEHGLPQSADAYMDGLQLG